MRRLLALTLVVLAGCESAGHFTFLGYTTRPNYDDGIRTVYVPMFQNQIQLDSTRRNIEVDLTRAVVREIEAKTPYKVVSHCDGADTELSGTVLTMTKNLLNRNQLNEIREAETVLTVGIVWRDLRSGEILSKPGKGQQALALPGIAALDIPDPSVQAGVPTPPPLPNQKAAAPVVLVSGIGSYIPEIGQSNSTGYQQAINRLATQIVSQMEKPW
ncbi:MAG: LPS assembly lipoprotein LptE [Gemmataceae bacterium]